MPARIRPSWKISVASVDMLPGTMPPTSFQCAMLAVQATISSPAKTGMTSTTSFRCVTPPLYGSLVMKTSPGSMSPGWLILLQDALDRLVEHADEGRDAGARPGQLAVPVGDAGAHVEHFVDDRAHGRVAHARRTSRRRPPAASSG